MSKESIILEIQDHDISYKKDEHGKIIDKFFLAIDKIIKNFKHFNSESVTFVKGGEIWASVEDKFTDSDEIVATNSSFARGDVLLEHKSYALVDHIFKGYSFTINPNEFVEFRKDKGKNTPIRLEIMDKEFVKINLIDGDEFVFQYDSNIDNIMQEYQEKVLSTAVEITPEPLIMEDLHVQNIREMKPTDIIKLVFDIKNEKIIATDYYDTKYNNDDHTHIIDMCKKYLVGFESKKKKEIYECSEIQAKIRRFTPSWNSGTLLSTNIRMINETHVLEQSFISLDMIDN